jgi:aldehyde dehydrogenase (NAD+)/betaine-aldehyde dehydrogenase
MTQTAVTRTAPEWAHQLLVDGELIDGEGEVWEVPNPATERTLTTVASANLGQVDTAIRAARIAFDVGPWSRLSGRERGAALHRIADEMDLMRPELVAAVVEEVGSPVPLAEAMQVDCAIRTLRTYADLAQKDLTEVLLPDLGTRPSASLVAYRPVGLVAIVSAYNYPLLLPIRTLGGVIAGGSTAVLLPSPRASLTALLLGQAIARADLPEGVVNIVLGGPDVGQSLTTHPKVDKIAFTGSLAVGETIMRQAATGTKGLSLELGGKSATILLPGFDEPERIFDIHARYTRNAGQGCSSPTRILVQRDYMPEFLDLSDRAFGQLAVGDPWDRSTIVGPLIRPEHRERVEGYVARALESGASIVAGGGRPAIEKGWYMNPTLLSDLDNSAEIAQNELFGPVGVVIPFDDIEDAIRIANDSPFGLAAELYTSELGKAFDMAARLQVGHVVINGGGGFRPDAPFGGFKASGIGREYGIWGIREFLEPQHVQWAL